jgi:two-component system cell cycle sensor histidine kinase/response regulator CckA
MERGRPPRPARATEETTEASQTELAQHESDTFFRFLVESSDQLVVLVDTAGCFVYASPSFGRLFGDVRALPFERIHRDDQAALRGVWRPEPIGARDSLVFRYLDPEGSCHWLECSTSGVAYRAEPYILAILREVSERERTEEARRVQLRLLESLHHVSDAIDGTDDVEGTLRAALSVVLDDLACDRAWLFEPTDSSARTLRVVMGRSRSDSPGAPARDIDIDIDSEAELTAAFHAGLATGEVLRFAPRDTPGAQTSPLAIHDAMSMAIRPQPDRPYLFVVNRCSPDRDFSEADARLFEKIGVLVSGALRSRFVLRDLRESEAKLGSAERIARVGYWDLDLIEDRFTWSEQAGRIFGRPFERPVTRAASRDFLHPEDRDAVRRESEAAMATGRSFEMEFRVQWQSGEVRFVHSHGDLLRDESGRPRSFFGTIQDVTERRLSEDRLRASEREFRATFELAAVGQAQADPTTGRLVRVNRKLCELLGYTEEALLAANFLDLTHPDDRARETPQFQRLVKGEIPELLIEKRMIRKDGAEVWVHLTASIIRDDDGRPLRSVAIGQDITLRKRAEQALLESHNLLNTVIEGTGDAVFVKDLQGRYRLINSAGARLLGRSVEDVVGKDDSALFSPETARQVMAHDRRVLASGTSLTSEEIGTAAGVTRTYHSTKTAQRDDQGKVIGLIGIARDITELKHLEEQFRHAQKMEAVGRLAGGVAHDFNNLLTVINGNADLLLQYVPGGPESELLGEIRQAGARAATLTNQLLAFSRKQVLQPEIVNLNVLLDALWKMLLRLIGEDVDLTFVGASDLGLVRVDPGQFEQAIINLAVNARDAMPEGGRLTLETRNVDLDETYAVHNPDVKPARYVCVGVKDSGAGMAPETRARIFEPFFTTKSRGKGTGLGLPMVYGFLKQSGGHVEVETEQGVGTTIRLYLPRVEGKVTASRTVRGADAAAGGTETILLVEDETSVRGLVGRILRKKGYRVLEAATGEEALTVAAEHAGTIHLLLTDLVMPRMSGHELALALTRVRTSLRVVFMSGYTDDGVRRGVEDSAVGFLHKPFTPAVLMEKIRAVLDAGDLTR